MFCFEVWKGRRKLATAGIPGQSVVSIIFSWVGRRNEATLNVGGLDSNDTDAHEFVDWIPSTKLKAGDSYTVRVVERERADVPKYRRSQRQVNRGFIDQCKRAIVRLEQQLKGQREALRQYEKEVRASARREAAQERRRRK